MKIADFGFAKTVDDMEVGIPGTLLGTPLYLPLFYFSLIVKLILEKYWLDKTILLNVMYFQQELWFMNYCLESIHSTKV